MHCVLLMLTWLPLDISSKSVHISLVNFWKKFDIDSLCGDFSSTNRIKSMVGSSGRQRVQQGVLNELELKVPYLEEQHQIGSFLAGLDNKSSVIF